MPEQDRKEMVLFCASGHNDAEMFKSREAVFPGHDLRVSLYQCPVCGEEVMNPCLVFSTLKVPVEYQTAMPEGD